MAAYKSVFITGASRGLGLEFVRLFLQLPKPPQHIFAACRNPDAATELKEIAKKHPNTLHTIKLDVTETGEFERVVNEVKKVVGANGLNLLLNNAGIYNKDLPAGIESFTREQLINHFDVNTVSPLLLAKAFHPLLKQASSSHENPSDVKKAVVAFVSSKLGCFSGYPDRNLNHPYRISKAALNMAVFMLGIEWKTEDILVTVLHPGWVRTDMGGSGADIDINTSVSGMVKVLLDVTEKNRGKLYAYDGSLMDW